MTPAPSVIYAALLAVLLGIRVWVLGRLGL